MSEPTKTRRAVLLVLLILVPASGLAIVWGLRDEASPAARVVAPGPSAVAVATPRPRQPPSHPAFAAPGSIPASLLLRGRVLTVAGAPIAAASIVIDRRNEHAASATTDEDGTFESMVEPGPVEIAASAAGFALEKQSFGEPRGPDHAIEVRLRRAAILVGEVVRDDTGERVPNCEVHVPREDDDGGDHPIVTTDANGSFRVDTLPSGLYAATARCPRLFGRALSVSLQPGETSARLRIRVRRAARVSGRLDLEKGGRPCERGEITLASKLGTELEAKTDPKGRVLFEAVPPGVYAVTVSCHEHVRMQRGKPLTVGDDDREIVFVAQEAATIRGTLVDASGEPIEGALVDAMGADGMGTSATYSGDDGAFALHDLLPGTYRVEGETGGATARATVIVVAGASPAPLRLVLDRPKLMGRIVDRDGRSVAGAHVNVGQTRERMGAMIEADDDGRFAIGDAAERVPTIKVYLHGRAVPIVSGDRLGGEGGPFEGDRIFVVDVPNGTLRGEIRSTTGATVAGASVRVRCSSSAQVVARTDDEGQFLVGRLQSDELCDAAVFAHDGETGTRERIAPGDFARVDLRAAATLRGVLAAGGRPFVITIQGTPLARRAIFEHPSGAWEMGGIPAGELAVEAETDTHLGSVEIAIAPGETKEVAITFEPRDVD